MNNGSSPDSKSNPTPQTMLALELRSYEGADALALVRKTVPAPRRGEVLVRVGASPVNPSDLMFLRGLYGTKKKLPVVPGFEAGGEVVAAGGGLLARYLVGKRVACAAPLDGDGTWAEYMVTQARLCIPLLKQTTTEQGALMIVNPFSAWALMGRAAGAGARGVAQTAAASALGHMIVRLAKRRGLPVVNVVRRRGQVEELRAAGAEHVLDSSEPDFDERLRDACRRLNVTVAFDAVAGEMPGRLLRAMPQDARVIVYGALSQEGCLVDPRSLIFEAKRVEGFWLSQWLRSQNPVRTFLSARRVQKLLGTDLKTEVRARLPLERAKEGLEQYAQQMTGGKVLFVPGLKGGGA